MGYACFLYAIALAYCMKWTVCTIKIYSKLYCLDVSRYFLYIFAAV